MAVNKDTLEGRMNYNKEEAIRLLKEQAEFSHFCEESGFVYNLRKNISGKLNEVILSLKNGHIYLLDMKVMKK